MALPTGRESSDFDARAIEAGVPQPVLMENAGRAAATILERTHPHGPVAVVAGSGNNGGDGVVLARSLASWGRRVRLVVVGDRPDPDPLLHGWTPETVRVAGEEEELQALLRGASVVVDALLGTGIRGAPREPQAAAIRGMNAAGLPIVALDVPSGIDADTGAVEGEAVKAALTIAFGAPKRGALFHPGREHVGRLVSVDIGFPPWTDTDASAFLATPGWAERVRPRRAPSTHKNAEGRLLLVVGSPRFGGAAVLAARAALRSGVGFLRVGAPAGLRLLLQSAAPEAVHVDTADEDALHEAVERSDALGVGPGVGTGPAAEALLRTLLGAGAARPALLDADALTLLARDPSIGAGGDAAPRGDDRAGRLLTPHPGEAARLLGGSASEVAADPVRAARRIAERYGATTLLKGSPSLVATPDSGEPVLVAVGGSSDLARAGMGDVLTGAAAGLLARGLGPAEAGGLALHLTARAAVLSGAGESVLPTDVARHLPAAFAERGDGASDLSLPSLLLDLAPIR